MWKKRIQFWLCPVLLGAAFFVLFKTILIVGIVPTTSMEPTIPAGSIVIGNRLDKEYALGDIVFFQRDGKLLLKRIAGMPGDIVQTAAGKQVVPQGAYYVRGDNAACSVDSMDWVEPFVREGEMVAVLLWK